MNKTLTHEEKIDYIYNRLRKQKQYAIFKVIFTLTIIIIVGVVSLNYLEKQDFGEIQKNIQEKMSDFIYPIIENMVDKNSQSQ